MARVQPAIRHSEHQFPEQTRTRNPGRAPPAFAKAESRWDARSITDSCPVRKLNPPLYAGSLMLLVTKG